MKANLDEKKIKDLFLDLRSTDERMAPGFDSLVHRPRHASPRIGWMRLAAAGILLVLVATSAAVIIRRVLRTDIPAASDPGEAVSAASPTPLSSNKGSVVRPDEGGTQQLATAGVRHMPARRTPRHGYIGRPGRSDLLISEWRSPTEFLLRSSGTEILRAAPRLDDSVIRLRPGPRDSNN
jgi:hypothetical protein